MQKNPAKIEFLKNCKEYNKGTGFLRFFVIYAIPIYIIFLLCQNDLHTGFGQLRLVLRCVMHICYQGDSC